MKIENRYIVNTEFIKIVWWPNTKWGWGLYERGFWFDAGCLSVDVNPYTS